MKKKLWPLVFLLLGVLGVGGLATLGFVAQAEQQAQRNKEALAGNQATVTRSDLAVKVVETGSLESVKRVEVKSQVGGRLARLLVDEGDRVEAGQLIAVIDPRETQLQVEQNAARLRGAQSEVRRTGVQIEQRRVTAQAQLAQARSRVKTLELEVDAQPQVTRAAIASAETALASAQKAIELLVNVTHPNARTQAETALEDAENNLQNTELQEKRLRELYDKGFVSRREWEQAQLQAQFAQTRVRQSRESLDRISAEQRLERERQEQQVRAAKADLDRARVNAFQDTTKRQEFERAIQEVRQAEAALLDIEQLQQQRASSQANVDQLSSSLGDSQRLLGETEVRAPISGVVTRRFVQEGELVNALSSFSAGTTLVVVEDRSAMIVKLEVNEIDVARLVPGMRAAVSVDALPDTPFAGRVTKIAPARLDAGQGAGAVGDPVVRYAVEVTLDDVDERLKTGMSARCEMTAAARAAVLTLPVAFVGRDEDGPYVMVRDESKEPVPARLPGEAPTLPATKTRVKTGLQTTSMVEITDGVELGTKVVRPPFTGPQRRGMMQFGPDDGEEEQGGGGGSGAGSGERGSE